MDGSKILNQIKLDYFLKFVVHKLNFEIVRSKMMLLTKREKIDMTDTDIVVD
jgi:hypothetical protein